MPKKPEDLARHNCIAFVVPSTGRIQHWHFRRDGRRFSIPVSGNLRFDHAEALVEAAAAGTALIQISSYVTAAAIKRRQLVPVLIPYQVDSPTISVLYPQSANPPPRIRAFVDFLVSWAARLEVESTDAAG